MSQLEYLTIRRTEMMEICDWLAAKRAEAIKDMGEQTDPPKWAYARGMVEAFKEAEQHIFEGMPTEDQIMEAAEAIEPGTDDFE